MLKYNIIQNNSVFKVGSDAFLLGSLAQFSDPSFLLDVGTGSGVLSLILASRYPQSSILALDKEPEAALCAGKNIILNRLENRIKVKEQDFLDTDWFPIVPISGIICNPPFYNAHDTLALKLAHARQEITFNLVDFLEKCNVIFKRSTYCSPLLWMIYPIERWEELQIKLSQNGFYLNQIILIVPKEGKPANRIIFSAALETPDTISKYSITIRNKDGNYTETYKNLCYHCHNENILFK